jgi:cysteinyl-tRNA synthetase
VNTRWPEGATHGTFGADIAIFEAANTAKKKFREALSNDLNTAEARAAIFDLVRIINTKADEGILARRDVPAVIEALDEFDAVFDVIKDHDAEPTRLALKWAEQVGRLGDVVLYLLEQPTPNEAIDALVAERTLAKRQRNFARADQIRNELAGKGVVIEDSKDGVRWKRK